MKLFQSLEYLKDLYLLHYILFYFSLHKGLWFGVARHNPYQMDTLQHHPHLCLRYDKSLGL